MATAKQKAWRAKFARLYGRKKRKTSTRPKTRKAKKARPMARRRRRVYVRRPRRSYSRSKVKSISLLTLAHYAMQFENITGTSLAAVAQNLINSILSGDDSFIDQIMAVVNGAITNVTTRPMQVAGRGALYAIVFSAIKSFVGSRTLIRVGKYAIRV